MIRRRRGTIEARRALRERAWGRALESQVAQAALAPRVARVVELLEMRAGRRYVDIGCGSATLAHVIAARAGLARPPLTLDLGAAPGVDAIAWPEQLPLADASVDALTCLYFVRRLDDDVLYNFAGEIARVLAPGGRALLVEFGPVRSASLDRLHRRLVSAGTAAVDLRGWGRLAALFTERGFDSIELVNVGPFVLPPIPRVAVLLQRAPTPARAAAAGA